MLVAGYFAKAGLTAKRKKVGVDGAVEFYLNRRGADKPEAFVHCKASPAFRVSPKVVREVFSVITEEKIAEGFCVSTNWFTLEAMEFATGKPLTLIAGADFLNRFGALEPADRLSLLKEVTADDYITPTCPMCAVKMVLRKGNKPVWGCPNHPRCYATMPVRTAAA